MPNPLRKPIKRGIHDRLFVTLRRTLRLSRQRARRAKDAPTPARPTRSLPTLHLFRAAIGNIATRSYALLLFAVLCWSGYLAVSYMFGIISHPSHVPPQFLGYQGRLDTAALRQEHVPGMTGTAGRAPIGHYHGVDRWFQPDPRNGCTTAGCHEPLPHSQRMKVPAFANFHTTFLDCCLCHEPAPGPGNTTWVSTSTGQSQQPPAVLQLQQYLDHNRDMLRQNPGDTHKTVTAHLRRALSDIGDDPILAELLTQFETSAIGGPVWNRTLDQLLAELPQHVRGEYAAKLAHIDDADRRKAATLSADAAAYLAAPPDSDARIDLKKRIHAGLVKEANACTACHGDPNPMLDYESLGYSPQRANSLRNVPLARLMQQIRQGERFFIPRLLEGK